MADQALILAQSDKLLPMANAQSGAAGGAGQGLAPDGAAVEERFSSVLDKRMQSPNGQRSPPTEKTATEPSAKTSVGDALPQNGNSLPLQSPSGLPMAGEAAVVNETIDQTTGLPISMLLSGGMPETLLPELLVVDNQEEATLSAEIPLASLNGLTPTDLLKTELVTNTGHQQAGEQSRQQSRQQSQQQAAQLTHLAMPQTTSGSSPIPGSVLPMTTAVTQGEAVVDERLQLPVIAARPLASNERLMLERVRTTGVTSAQGSVESLDKGLPRDLLSLVGLEGRRAILASTQIKPNISPHNFKPVLNQLSAPLMSVIGQDEESTYSSMLSSVQRGPNTFSAQPMPVLNIASTVGQQGWSNEMSQRVAWMANTEVREAQLKLHPRHLGPLEVRISFGQEQQLNVNFTVTNPLAREAVDAALPRLREMFEQQGMNLQDANVSQESYAEQQQRRRQAEGFNQGESSGNEELPGQEMAVDMQPQLRAISEGLIDMYA